MNKIGDKAEPWGSPVVCFLKVVLKNLVLTLVHLFKRKNLIKNQKLPLIPKKNFNL